MFRGIQYNSARASAPLFCLLILLTLNTLTGCSDDEPIRTPWKYGIVPYCLIGDFSENEITEIHEAMDAWETATGVHFVHDILYHDNSYHIYKVESPNLSFAASTIGYEEGNNYMISGDISYSNMLHELGHCLGLQHEHQRLDRDLFIMIFWDNLDMAFMSQFTSLTSDIYPMQKFPYDYHSIMHYDEYSGSKNGDKTIETFGHRDTADRAELSYYDTEKVMTIYNTAPDPARVSGTDLEPPEEDTPDDDETINEGVYYDNNHS